MKTQLSSVRGIVSSKWFKFLLVMTILTLDAVAVYAVPTSGSLKTGLEAGYNELNGAVSIIEKILYVVSAIIGFIGGVKVYNKWSSGDPDTTKIAASWFGGAAFIVVVGVVIRTLFLS